MFGFGRKRKLEEFAKKLSSLGDIPEQVALKYVEENKQEINAAFSRGLDPQLALLYIAENQMERIYVAHKINELHHIRNIQDYWLLVCLQYLLGWQKAGVSSEKIDANFNYFNKVLKIVVDDVLIYDEKLMALTKALNAK